VGGEAGVRAGVKPQLKQLRVLYLATFSDVIVFYNTRFNLNLSRQDMDDLAAFLKTL